MRADKINPLKELHPQWFQATDYNWLKHSRRATDISHTDTSDCNRLDDIHRRDMASWSRDLEDFGA